jgi:phage gp36-like protein
MGFITDDDYRVVVGETALKTISQQSEEIRRMAEDEAVEEMSGYLRPTYDCDRIFGAEGSDRNKLLVMMAVDMALYHMVASQPQKFGMETRKERYERAVRWLEGVQAGKIVPDLPRTEESDEDGSIGTSWYSEKPLRHNW